MAAFSDLDKAYKKQFHRRNNSGEVDVFEAARYFSGVNELTSVNYRVGGGRISVELPTTMMATATATVKNAIVSKPRVVEMEKQQKKEKKYKQPSSPGGKLASFLNSLFNQTASKKKKPKSSSTQSMKDEDESSGGRRKRRSSISHFPRESLAESRSFHSSSSSGFRTPPIIRSYKDLRSYSDHKQVSISTVCANTKPSFHDHKELDLGKEFKFENVSEKLKSVGNGISEKGGIWVDEFPSAEKIDDGCESDSSSDLFELQNYDLGSYSSDLPVYETTHVDSIKRGVLISNLYM